MTHPTGRYRVGFAAACAAPACLGLGSAVFFLLPNGTSVLTQLLIGGLFITIAYVAFLRYDSEVDRLIATGEFSDRSAKFVAFRPSAAIRVAALGEITPSAARALLSVAMTVLAVGVGVGLALSAIG